MHVTRVELENIKSHVHSEYTFDRGTTAITGENGAGKTTIIEAIAWALFDTLEYSKDDFLRRGAKKGSVRVTFESDLDERQYTIYRDTGQGYYVYDHGLNMRIAEKKKDVSDFLRAHLGIEPGTDLKSLYRSAIGVPQGSFTAEFLLAPNARKASFDRLLKVEEYREGAERLRDTVSLIRERTAEARERIAGAEGQLASYDRLVEEHAEASARERELAASLDELQREMEERARTVEEMDAAETRAGETRMIADRLEVERDAGLRRAADLRVERDAASAAMNRQRAAESEHLAHMAALDL
ncbi:MAG: SMC family ATPase, partial [Pyrinomonadaceae bacterium]